MLRRFDNNYPVLLAASLLLALGIYSNPAWNAVFSGLAVLFAILCARAFIQKEITPEPPHEQPQVEKQIYLMVGPYVNQWFSARRQERLHHSVTGATWLCAATQGELIRLLARLNADPERLKVTLFFPFFPDGHETSALLINALHEWRQILQSPILAEPLPCIFALYSRCSEERFAHDPDCAIWHETGYAEQTLCAGSVECLIPLRGGETAFLRSRKAILALLWRWMAEEHIASNLNATFSHSSSTLMRVMVADYGTGFNRHGAWSRWLEENFALLPALGHSKVCPPLPELPATVVIAPAISPAPARTGSARGRRQLLIISLLMAASVISARHHEQKRADEITRTITSLANVPAEDIRQTLGLLNTLGAQRDSLEACSSSLFFQNWGFSRCAALGRLAEAQLKKYTHWIVFSSASHASLFASGSATILPGKEHLLLPLATLIDKNPEVTFLIVGHTDNSGDEKNNVLLSEQRAREVRDWLLLHTRADRLQFVLKGEGDAFPLASNLTPAGKEMNRRIEIFPLHPTPINVNEHIL